MGPDAMRPRSRPRPERVRPRPNDLSACVCLSAIISPELYVRSSSILCLLLMAVARSFSDGVVIRYEFTVLWMTSYMYLHMS